MKTNFDLKALAFKFSRMKGHEDDGLFFGVEEALPVTPTEVERERRFPPKSLERR